MIRYTPKQIAAVALPQGKRGTASQKGKQNRLGAVLTASFLMLALGGCCVLTPPLAKIHFYPDAISIKQGQTIALEAHRSAFDQSDDWNYQWQTVLGDDGTDIPDANRKELVLKNVAPADGKLYRCVFYRPGEFGETNYTATEGLHVIAFALIQSLGTPIDVSGPFQPGKANPCPKGSCCAGCTNFMQLVSTENSIWWVPETGATNGVFTYLPAPGQAGRIMVLNSGALQEGGPWCGTTNVDFPVVPGKEYQLIVCFSENAPPKGTPLQFSITWNR